MKFWNVVINYMGQEKWVGVEAETIEEAKAKFTKAFPRYIIKEIHEDKI